MSSQLMTLQQDLGRWCRDLDPSVATPAQAREAICELAQIEKQAAGARLRLTRCLEPDTSTTDWLAEQTGQSRHDAGKDLEAAQTLDGLDATDQALKNGELSADQAREVTSGASADPAAEQELLDTARNGSMAELRRKAKAKRAAATDEPTKNEKAHENRDVSHGADTETGQVWMHVKGPAAVMAQLLAFLEPFVQAEFKLARSEGRSETRGTFMFDALVKLFAAASAGRGSGVGAPAQIIARTDVTALLRGHTVAGETCDIEGVGPVPVAALLELLPRAAIDLIVTKGEDVFNVTHFGRKTTTRQHVVLHWLGAQCARQGCGATRNLQIDHRIDWAKTHVTELRALEWMCPSDHRLKTCEDWALVHGRGKRRMVPPDDPDHPNNANVPPDANAPPEADAA